MNSIPAVLMPVILMGGIVSGIFTPTEAAGVAVAYALIIAAVVYRSLNLRILARIGVNVARESAAIFFLIGTAGIFGWILARVQVPQMASDFIIEAGLSAIMFLILVNLLLLVWGMFMDAGPGILILGPVLAPMAVAPWASDPIHFGVLMVFNLMIGLMTPPYGLCLFAGVALSGSTMGRVSMDLWPFILVSIMFLFIITFFPEVVLFLPKLTGLM